MCLLEQASNSGEPNRFSHHESLESDPQSMSAASERISTEHSTEVVIAEASTGDPRDGFPTAASVNDEGSLERNRTGERIGSYRITGILGTGGMGAVYEAVQEHPVRRTVALKIVKPGFAHEQVIARFEAERQALAMMEHPNIARVLDAGTTTGGQPFFVMELVRGVPIAQYCDKERMTLRQRLALFVDVCRGDPARPSERGHPSRHQAL